MYWRFAIGVCLRHQLCATGSAHSCIAYSDASLHTICCAKSFPIFFSSPVRFCSTRCCLYLGHPMRTVLFLVLDRPAIAQLTYHSNSSQPGNTQCQTFTGSLYSIAVHNTHERTFFSSNARNDGRTNRKIVLNAKSLYFLSFASCFAKERNSNNNNEKLPYFSSKWFRW